MFVAMVRMRRLCCTVWQRLESVHLALLRNDTWQSLELVVPESSRHIDAVPAKRVMLAFRAFGGDYGLGFDVEQVLPGPTFACASNHVFTLTASLHVPPLPQGGSGAPSSSTVSHVSHRMWGASCPVKLGDKLLSVNGTPVDKLTAEQVLKQLHGFPTAREGVSLIVFSALVFPDPKRAVPKAHSVAGHYATRVRRDCLFGIGNPR